MASGSPRHSPASGPVRGVLYALGVAFVGLGTAGAFLPLLPTTPFLLLAAACFVRSSPERHRRLLANRLFGPYLAQWQRDRSIPRAAKHRACALVLATFALSIALVDASWQRGLLAVVMVALLAFLARLPTGGPDGDGTA